MINFREPAGGAFSHSRNNILVKRFTGRAGFFAAIQDCDDLDGWRQGLHEVIDREGPVQMNFDDAYLLALVRAGIRQFRRQSLRQSP